jgi:hypothetical protein
MDERRREEVERVTGDPLGRARHACRELVRRADAAIERANAESVDATGRRVVCARHCDACCRYVVTCSMLEAVVIVAELGEQGRAAWLERNVLPLCAAHEDELLRPDATCLSWHAANRRCVLETLWRDCAVYDVRPVMCRTYLACAPEAPAACAVVGAAVPGVDLRAARAALLETCLDLSKAAGLPPVAVPLPVALLWAHAWLRGGAAAWERLVAGRYRTVSPDLLTLRWATLEAPELAEDPRYRQLVPVLRSGPRPGAAVRRPVG